MKPNDRQIEVLGADRIRGGLLVHFSDGLSVLFHAKVLYDVRNDDGNVPISNDPVDEGGTEQV